MKKGIKNYFDANRKYLMHCEPLRITFNYFLIMSIVFELWNLATAYWLWDTSHYTIWFLYGVPDILYSMFVGYALGTIYGVFALPIFMMSIARTISNNVNPTQMFAVVDSTFCFILLIAMLMSVITKTQEYNESQLLR